MPLKQIWKITATTIHDEVTVRNTDFHNFILDTGQI